VYALKRTGKEAYRPGVPSADRPVPAALCGRTAE